MAKRVQVLLLSQSTQSRGEIYETLNDSDDVEVTAQAVTVLDALQKITVFPPDIVLIDEDGMNEIETVIQRITTASSTVSIVVLSTQSDTEGVRRCMRAGAKDYLVKPVSSDVLTAALMDVHTVEQKRRERNTVAVLSGHFTHQSRVLSFISSKGGVGKTTISANMAAALSAQGKRVVLVDMDLQFGDTGLFLGLSPTKTILDLITETGEIDPDVIEQYLTLHSPGLYVLSPPRRPEEAEYVTPADVKLVLQSLRQRFDYVIVDTTPIANDVFFAVMEGSDACYMVSTLNLAVLKNNRMLLDVLTAIDEQNTSVIQHVLNRANAKNGVKVKDAVRVLKTDIYAEIDNDFQFIETSINEGIPFVIKDKNHRLSRQLYALIARIEEGQGKTMSRRNPLRKWLNNRRSS